MKCMTNFTFTPVKIEILKIQVTYKTKIKSITMKYILYISIPSYSLESNSFTIQKNFLKNTKNASSLKLNA